MKIFAIALFALLAISVFLISCSKDDGKCNVCGDTAYEVTEEDEKYMKLLGIKYKDELCQKHYQEKMMAEMKDSPLAKMYAKPDNDFYAKLDPEER